MAWLKDPRWLVAQSVATVTLLLAAVVAAFTLHAPTAVGPDTLRLVGSAGAAAAAAGSYRMELDMTVRGAGQDLGMSGTADLLASGAGAGSMSLPGGLTMRFIASTDHAWIQLPEGSPQRLNGKEWVGFPVPTGQAGLTQDPMDFLKVLSGDSEVLDLGPDEVRGVATRHYKVDLDVEELMRLAQEQGAGMLGGGLPAGLEVDGQAELWLDEQALPRRMDLEIDASGITVDFSFELFEYGVDVDVSPPPAQDVVEAGSQQEAMQYFTNP